MILFEQEGADDVDDVGPAFGLLVETRDRIGAGRFWPVGTQEDQEGEPVGPRRPSRRRACPSGSLIVLNEDDWTAAETIG